MNQGSNTKLTETDYDRLLDDALASTNKANMRKKKSQNAKKEQSQLSKQEHELIFDTALDQSRATKPNQKQIMNPNLKRYLSTSKVLIHYVRDMNGFLKGLVLATAKDRIGWSIVSTRDISLQRIDPMNIPILKKMIEEESPIADIMSHKAYLKCIRDHSSVTVPTFDKETGFLIALGRSLISKVEEKEGKLYLEPAPPNDKELRSAISKMAARAKRYFR